MSQLLVQFNNRNNWIRLYTGLFTVTPIGSGTRYVPIPESVLPVLSDERILAAKATSAAAIKTWKTGGWLTPIIDLVSTEFGEARLSQHRVPLGYAGFIILPEFAQSYRLRLSIPRWIKDVRIDVWQYIGPIDDSTEKLIRELGDQLNLNL
jgi:hypothetical protein